MTILLRQKPLPQVVRQIVQRDNGALFDPSDLSTLFQDAAGTIPVTAVEQPVGLVLDKSQGLMLGPELVVNGDFSNGSTGWSLGTGWSVPALSAVFTGVTAGELRQNILTVGRMYKIEFDVAVNAQYIGLLSGSLTPQTIITTSGHKTLYLTATSSVFSVYAGKNANIVLDNISVRELYGYHATQSITASRPTLSARYNLLTKTEDFSNSAWAKEFGGVGSTPVVTQNYATAPDGTMTATRIVYALNGGTATADYSRVYQPVTLSANTQTVLGVWLKSASSQTKNIVISMAGEYPKVVSVGTDWAFIPNAMIRADTNYSLRIELRGAFGTSDSADILIWHPDLRIGTTPGPYQRVNTSTDYDTDERYFPKYLRFDGVDDYLNLPYMGLYANGSASVVAGVYLRPKAITQYIIGETTSTASSSRYGPLVIISDSPLLTTLIRSDSSVEFINSTNISDTLQPLPSVTSVVDAGNSISMRTNGVLVSTANYSRTSTLTANTTAVGALAQSTALFFAQMNLYSLIITKSALSDAQRIKCERYAASKAGVQL